MNKAFLTILALIFFTANAFAPDVSSGYKPGDHVKDFSLKNIDNKKVSLAGYTNAKGFIVVFTCNHCPFSKAYEQRIIDLDNKYAKQGFPVIAINPNDPAIEPEDSFENMQALSKDHSYPFPYLIDETQETAKAFGAARTPHVFVIEKKEKDFIVRYIGAIDNNTEDASAATSHYVQDAVEELLAGKQVSVPATKAIGCSVKWKKA